MKNYIEIYTGPFCNFCVLAKKLLNKKNIQYYEIDISKNLEKRSEMLFRTNGKSTIPQIFINNEFIGGFTELNALEISGKLDKLLNT